MIGKGIKLGIKKQMFYSMGQVSEMLDLPQTTVRYWEKNFKQLKPTKNAKGNRLFSPEDVENLKLIYHLLKERKMTLAGAQEFMEHRRVALKRQVGIVELLQNIRSSLLEIRQEIETADKAATTTAKEVVITPQIDPETEPEKPRYIELSLFD